VEVEAVVEEGEEEEAVVLGVAAEEPWESL
jgi:hypothetical protein